MAQKRSIGYVKQLDENKYLLRLSLGFDDFGKRIQPSKTVTCSSAREADRLLLEFYNEREKLLAEHTSAAPKTLGQLYAHWIEHHVEKSLRRKTAEWYKILWRTHLENAAQLKLKVIAPIHLHKILDSISSDRSRNAVYKMLKAMLAKGVKWGYMIENPCDRIDTPKYKAPEKKALTEAEIKKISTEIIKEPLKYQAAYYFAIMCSLRRQEIIGLKWSDIDFNENSFAIKRAATQLDGVGTVADETKTQKSKRTLFLPEILKNILIRLNNEQQQEKIAWGEKWTDEDWIFTQQGGKLMCLATPSHWWSDFAKKCGVEDVTFHGLRHTAATYMIKNNVPISTVSGVLGHANISTTLNTYTHVIEDTKMTAINIMADVVSGAETTPENSTKII